LPCADALEAIETERIPAAPADAAPPRKARLDTAAASLAASFRTPSVPSDVGSDPLITRALLSIPTMAAVPSRRRDFSILIVPRNAT
jgi:hypothetical protein